MVPTGGASGSVHKGKGKRSASGSPEGERRHGLLLPGTPGGLLLPGMTAVPSGRAPKKLQTTTAAPNRPVAGTVTTSCAKQGNEIAKINPTPRTVPAVPGPKALPGFITGMHTPPTGSINDPAGKDSGPAPPEVQWPGTYELTPMNQLRAGRTSPKLYTVGSEMKFQQQKTYKWGELKKNYQLTVHVGPAVGDATAGSSNANLVFWVTVKYSTTLVYLSAKTPPADYVSGNHSNLGNCIATCFHEIVPPEFITIISD